MTARPKFSAGKHSNEIQANSDINDATSSPTINQSHQLIDNDYSPVFIPNSQLSQENDVLWDWNSPVSKSKKSRKPKRLLMNQIRNQSPKLHIQNTKVSETKQKSAFEKMKEELKDFQNEINASNKLPKANNNNCSELEDFFNDSFTDMMLQTTKQVEEEILSKNTDVNDSLMLVGNNEQSPRNTFMKSFSSDSFTAATADSPVLHRSNLLVATHNNRSSCLKKNNNNTSNLIDDSMDAVLNNLDDSDINAELLSIPVTPLRSNINKESPRISLKIKSLSFDNCYSSRSSPSESTNRNQGLNYQEVSPECDSSSSQCSQLEIEQKRQQALAKLEAKKKKLIEKNRKEALKRLESKKKKLI